MIDFFEGLIAGIFKDSSFFATFFISMVPIIEVKGAIPFGMSETIFAGKALSPLMAWLASALGSFVPVVFMLWLFKPIIRKLKSINSMKILAGKIENVFTNKAVQIKENGNKLKNETLKKCISLTVFVAIPLPLTGGYMGSIIASYLNIGFLKSISCIFVGNVIAGGIVVLFCTILKGYEIQFFIGFLAIALIFVLFKIIKFLVYKINANKTKL